MANSFTITRDVTSISVIKVFKVKVIVLFLAVIF